MCLLILCSTRAVRLFDGWSAKAVVAGVSPGPDFIAAAADWSLPGRSSPCGALYPGRVCTLSVPGLPDTLRPLALFLDVVRPAFGSHVERGGLTCGFQ